MSCSTISPLTQMSVARSAKAVSAVSHMRSPAKCSTRKAVLRNAVEVNGDIVFDSSSPLSSNTRDKEFPLYDYQNIPHWLEGNPFITSYYRCGYSTSKCFQSIFALHNETVNIWSHMFGFVVASLLAFHVMVHMELGRKRDVLMFSLLEVGSLTMLGCSSVYHTLSAHYSSRVHDCALAIDYFGISLMILGSFYPIVFYIFACLPTIRMGYFAIVTTLGLISVMGPYLSSQFYSARYYYVRLALFCGTAAIGGLLPGIHMYVSLPANELTRPVFNGVFLTLCIYLIGVLIYIFKIPESRFPGKFDLILSSHQLWHFFVLSAAVVQYFTAIAAFQLWRVTGDAGGECV